VKDTATDHSRCDILIRHLEQTVEGLKEDKCDLQKKLEEKERDWLEMFKQIYNLSKGDGFH
jgi:hypothetical protein